MKKRLKKILIRYRHFWAALVFTTFVYWLHSVPDQLFKPTYSTVLFDHQGKLLFAQIADDGQWRFPPGEVPEKFKTCILAFEDRNFYRHWGVSFKGIARATFQNIKNGGVVSGGSTLTMQLMRMSEQNNNRSISNKVHEIMMATRIEWKLSKDSILALYTAHAPMGGNVVGLEAAAWRYFGKSPNELSWAESATLAVLPNAPGLLHPGRNRNALEDKRNRLLKYLYESDQVDELTYKLAIQEPLPNRPLPLPQKAIHLLSKANEQHQKQPERQIHSTIDSKIQKQVENILWMHYDRLAANEIHNAASVVMDIETGKTLAYVGNIPDLGQKYDGDVDIIQAPRSSGSILKPFLYAMALDDGHLTKHSLVEDIPTFYSGYQPKNYNENFDGLVPFNEALQRSLNVPFVRLLQKIGIQKLLHLLKSSGFSTIDKTSQHYGLSLILGGAEVSLWDLVCVYRAMAHKLSSNAKTHASYIFEDDVEKEIQISLSKGAIWQTFESMVEVPRPGEEMLWDQFSSSQKIAWKTGTSFGYRDAWSVGISGKYVVGVWVGNADGEGRPGIIGREAAAPILFDIFRELPNHQWFERPEGLVPVDLCETTGFIAGDYCEKTRYGYTPHLGERIIKCPYHHQIYVTENDEYKAFINCCSDQLTPKNFLVIPPLVEKYYQYQNPSYQKPPPLHPSCNEMVDQDPMQWVYPKPGSVIYVPVNFDEEKEKAVVEISHEFPERSVHWHLDDEYIGTTIDRHQLEINPVPGQHKISVIDEKGNISERIFEVVAKD